MFYFKNIRPRILAYSEKLKRPGDAGTVTLRGHVTGNRRLQTPPPGSARLSPCSPRLRPEASMLAGLLHSACSAPGGALTSGDSFRSCVQFEIRTYDQLKTYFV